MKRTMNLIMTLALTLTTWSLRAGVNPQITEAHMEIVGFTDIPDGTEASPGAFIALGSRKEIKCWVNVAGRASLSWASTKIEVYDSATGGTPLPTEPASSSAGRKYEFDATPTPRSFFIKGVAVSAGLAEEKLLFEALHVAPYPHDIVAFTIVKVELKVTHPQNPGPTESAAVYTNTPITGSADNLFSVWNKEHFMMDVKIEPAFFASSLPAGFIIWPYSAGGFSIPNNTMNYTFNWSSTGTKEVTVNFPLCGLTKKVYVDVPDVGDVSEQQALMAISLLGPSIPGRIIMYGVQAKSYVNDPANGFGPTFGYQRWDAFRHAYWNALCVSDALVTSGMTELVTTGHEYNNKHGISAFGLSVDPQQAFNTTMDLHNNAVGRGCAHTTLLGLPDRSAIISDINTRYTNGELWIWDGPPRKEGDSEGILLKSNGAKIY
jgi:hypothetical protein